MVFCFYEKDAFGNIIGIMDNSFNLLAKYEYDAWGNILNIVSPSGTEITDLSHIAIKNLFRYKGYYYDSENDFYYLNSRYYSPKLKRFLNPDSELSQDILGYNLYLYCENNPILRKDEEGEGWVFGLITAAAFAGVTILSNLATHQKWNKGILGSAASGYITGLSFPTSLALCGVAKAVFNVCTSAVGPIINEVSAYIPVVRTINGQSKKELTVESAIKSVGNFFIDFSINSLISAMNIDKNITTEQQNKYLAFKFFENIIGVGFGIIKDFLVDNSGSSKTKIHCHRIDYIPGSALPTIEPYDYTLDLRYPVICS